MDTISFEDFKKLEIRIGKIVTAEKIEKADRLLKLEVDLVSEKIREASYQHLIWHATGVPVLDKTKD